MILPNVRASFGSDDVQHLLSELGDRTRLSRKRWESQLLEAGLDSVLDEPETLSAISEGNRVTTLSPTLAFYVMVRHTLLESGIDDTTLADYVAALLIEFATQGRANRIARYDDKTYNYLIDVVSELEDGGSDGRQFLLRVHLGNFSLWLSGLFPDFVVARVHRRGAPGLGFYEDWGAAGYRMASECQLAGRYDLSQIYCNVAERFSDVRRALNKISDRYLFPSSSSPVDRLLRQLIDADQSD